MKKCLIYGNCQTGVLNQLLQENQEFKANYQIVQVIKVHLLSEQDVPHLEELIKDVDLFIYQRVRDNYQGILQLGTNYLCSRVKPSCQSIAIPGTYFTGYNPEIINLKDRDGNKVTPKLSNYHDFNIITCFLQGKTIAEVVNLIQSDNFYSSQYIISNLDHTLAELNRRELNTDIGIAGFIQQYYQKYRLFHTINHPQAVIIRYIANTIFKMVGLSYQAEEKLFIESAEFLDDTYFPIYPSIYQTLNLKFTNELRYRLKNKFFTLQEAVEKFFEYYENNFDLVKLNYLNNREKFSVNQVELKSPLNQDFVQLSNQLVDLTKKLDTKNHLSQAIAVCQAAVTIAPSNIQAQQQLTTLKQIESNDKSPIVKAKEQSNVKNSVSPSLIQLGDQAQAQNNWKKAASFYQQVIDRNRKVQERIYLELQYAQQQLGNQQEADQAYKRWIENYYLVEHSQKVAYCPIGKNACTLLKNMLLSISPEKENYQQSNLKMHEYIDRNKELFTLKDFSYLDRSDYFKFIIIRNPFKRLVSTYVDKFVQRRNNKDPHALPVIKNVYEYLGLEANFAKSITFSQFVDYLLRTEDRHLDGHWRPQSVYFASDLVKFDFVGQFEKLDTVISYLEEKLDLKIDANVSKHRLDYGDFASGDKFNNIYPEELSKLSATPKSRQFYTPQLEEKVRIRYAEDIAIYEEEFNLTLGSQF